MGTRHWCHGLIIELRESSLGAAFSSSLPFFHPLAHAIIAVTPGFKA
jgi:hypothetical protein